MRHLDRFRGRSVDVDLLRALARDAQRGTVAARELAAVLARPVQAVTPKLRSLVNAGLASRHRAPGQLKTSSYTITDDGRDYLRRLADRERRSRSRR